MLSKSESARERWARIIREQRKSGQTVTAFCASRGIAVSSFYPWKRRLADAAATQSPAFVEARVGPDDQHAERQAHAGHGVTIVLASKRRIVVDRGFDRVLLLEVIEALEAAGDAS